MMGFFRSRMFKGIIMWLMAIVFAVMFGMVVAGLDPSMMFSGGGQWAMKVNGDRIGVQEYQQAVKEASDRSQQRRQAGQDVDIDKDAQDLVITRALALQQATEGALVPEPRQLQRAVGKSADLADQYRAYRVFPQAQGMDLFWRSQALNGLRDTMQNMPIVTDDELRDDFKEQNTKAKLRFVEFTYLSKEADIEVSDEDARAYYAAHTDLFWRSAGVDVEYVKVDPKKVVVDVSDDEIRSYYERHKSDYEQEEEVKASHILAKVEEDASDEGRDAARTKIDEVLALVNAEGADFAELAREHSDDVGSRPGGGDLGFFKRRGAMVEPFAAAAFALAAPGDVSDVVESRFGYHIIRLTERRKPTQTLTAVRGDIENTLRAAAQVEKAREDSEELFFEIDADGVEAAVAQEQFASYAAALASTGYVSRSDTTIPDIGPSYHYSNLIETAFETRPGVWTRPLELKQQRGTTVLGYFITRVKSTRPAGVASFEEVEDDVVSLLKKQRARERAVFDANALWAMYDGSEDIDSLAAKYEAGDGATTPTLVPRDSSEFPSRPDGYVSGMGYSLPAMVAALQMDQDEVRGVFEGRRAAYIVQLTGRTDADMEELTDAELTNLRTRAVRLKGDSFFGVWYEDVRSSAVIERNADVIAAF